VAAAAARAAPGVVTFVLTSANASWETRSNSTVSDETFKLPRPSTSFWTFFMQSCSDAGFSFFSFFYIKKKQIALQTQNVAHCTQTVFICLFFGQHLQNSAYFIKKKLQNSEII
jgi:hypothetical protein